VSVKEGYTASKSRIRVRMQARPKKNIHSGRDIGRDQIRIQALTPLEGAAYKLMGKTKRDLVRSGTQLKGKKPHTTSA